MAKSPSQRVDNSWNFATPDKGKREKHSIRWFHDVVQWNLTTFSLTFLNVLQFFLFGTCPNDPFLHLLLDKKFSQLKIKYSRCFLEHCCEMLALLQLLQHHRHPSSSNPFYFELFTHFCYGFELCLFFHFHNFLLFFLLDEFAVFSSLGKHSRVFEKSPKNNKEFDVHEYHGEMNKFIWALFWSFLLSFGRFDEASPFVANLLCLRRIHKSQKIVKLNDKIVDLSSF